MEAMDQAKMPVALEAEGIDVRAAEVGELTAGWFRLAKGTDLRPALVGLPDDRCPCPHWGYMISGLLRMHTSDGQHDYAAGQAFYWPPGHAPEALEDCEYIDFSPSAELARVVKHIQGG
jgi:hypothetical protein